MKHVTALIITAVALALPSVALAEGSCPGPNWGPSYWVGPSAFSATSPAKATLRVATTPHVAGAGIEPRAGMLYVHRESDAAGVGQRSFGFAPEPGKEAVQTFTGLTAGKYEVVFLEPVHLQGNFMAYSPWYSYWDGYYEGDCTVTIGTGWHEGVQVS